MNQRMYQDKSVSIMYDKVVRNVDYKGYENVDIYTTKKTLHEEGVWEQGIDESVWEVREQLGWNTMYETYRRYTVSPIKSTYVLTWIVKNEKVCMWEIYRVGWADKIASMERYDPRSGADYETNECYDYVDEIEGVEGWLGNARMWNTLTGQNLPKYF